MKLKNSLIARTSVDFVCYPLGQYKSTASIGSDTSVTFNTNSIVFIELFRAQYTIGESFVIHVVSMYARLFTNNSANGACKFQISGDGGTTFTDMSVEISSGLLSTSGSGLWINTIQTGLNKLVIRCLGKSTDGLAANIIIRPSSIDVVINQRTS